MSDPLDSLRVAIVHDWFAAYAGSERVVEQILHIVPQADVYALVDFLPDSDRAFLGGRTVTTSYLQKMPFARWAFRKYLSLMPRAIEQFDMSDYDLVISSSHAVAKGVLTGPDQLHVCVCHSPMRYAWDLYHQYIRGLGPIQKAGARTVLYYLRQWDCRTANAVDEFVAVSRFIARRIRKYYRRRSTVIYPPVDVDSFPLRRQKQEFYLAASRLVPYKRMDMIAEAFAAMPGRKLVIIGDGPDLKNVRKKAAANVTLMGYQPHDVLLDHMQRARALVFAAREDFGIVPVEAQACGTPVIAYGRGGAVETVIPHQTGVLFDEQTPESLIAAVEAFEQAGPFDPDRLRENAERFRIERFRRELGEFIARRWVAFERRSQRT